MECNSWVTVFPNLVRSRTLVYVQYICACSHSIYHQIRHRGPLHSGRAGDFALRLFFSIEVSYK
jgi:hypothetical protein